MKKVILIGYMGSGKSIIARELAKYKSIKYVDLDDLIVENSGMSVKNFFIQKGELSFRKMEHQLFSEKLKDKSGIIISTGGGTPCYFNNYKLYENDNCISIYLKASIETLYNRLNNGVNERPLLANLNENEVKEFIAKQLFERSYYYNKALKVVVVDNKSVIEIVSEINDLLS